MSIHGALSTLIAEWKGEEAVLEEVIEEAEERCEVWASRRDVLQNELRVWTEKPRQIMATVQAWHDQCYVMTQPSFQRVFTAAMEEWCRSDATAARAWLAALRLPVDVHWNVDILTKYFALEFNEWNTIYVKHLLECLRS